MLASVRRAACAGLAVLAVVCAAGAADARARIKDLVQFEGVRRNQLIGYGLVVGLNGTGDRIKNAPFTDQSLQGMLERLGVGVRDAEIKSKNVAAVMVTAELPPFARKGNRIDVTVASMGDATSLQGGTLLVTPMMAADGEVHAVAQGALTVGGFAVKGQAGSVTEGVPTTGRLIGGATVEREIEFDLASMTSFKMALRDPDFTTAQRIAEAVNARFGVGAARMLDGGTVEVIPSGALRGDVARMIAAVESIEVETDGLAKVVIDAKSGTVVIGDKVRIDRVAVSQGGLTVRITETPQVSQPEAFSQGQTTAVPRTDVQVERKDAKFVMIDAQPTLQDLVDGLNAIGVGARETISILQAIKAAGALHADLEVM